MENTKYFYFEDRGFQYRAHLAENGYTIVEGKDGNSWNVTGSLSLNCRAKQEMALESCKSNWTPETARLSVGGTFGS